jgi:hypothetical protein
MPGNYHENHMYTNLFRMVIYFSETIVPLVWPTFICVQEALVKEIKEADEVTAVCGIGKGKFGYTLANCTVGVYAGSNRAWRVKSKNAAHCICAHAFDGSGDIHLLSGWSNGKVWLVIMSLTCHGKRLCTCPDQVHCPDATEHLGTTLTLLVWLSWHGTVGRFTNAALLAVGALALDPTACATCCAAWVKNGGSIIKAP